MRTLLVGLIRGGAFHAILQGEHRRWWRVAGRHILPPQGGCGGLAGRVPQGVLLPALRRRGPGDWGGRQVAVEQRLRARASRCAPRLRRRGAHGSDDNVASSAFIMQR